MTSFPGGKWSQKNEDWNTLADANEETGKTFPTMRKL
jgi:hypothetical protein